MYKKEKNYNNQSITLEKNHLIPGGTTLKTFTSPLLMKSSARFLLHPSSYLFGGKPEGCVCVKPGGRRRGVNLKYRKYIQ
jgi:hypothetical protein